ncbi:class D beta-lactamase, partial [Acinetobacter baumannii]
MNIKALLLITSAIFISACSPYIVTANPNHSASKSDVKAEKIKNLFNEAHTTG